MTGRCSTGSPAAGGRQRVLLTGAGGFLGRAVVAALAARGHEVVALVRPGGRLAPEATGQVTAIAVDLDDGPGLQAVLEQWRPATVLHLAWFAKPGAFWSAPQNLDDVARSLRLIQLAAAAGVTRFVGAGSCAEYDWSLGAKLREAETPCRPHSLYGVCKLAVGGILEHFSARVGMSAAWLRYNFLFGPGEAPGRLVPQVLESLARGGDVDCSEGRQRRDFAHVDDAAAATAAVMESELRGAVNIGSGRIHSVREVVETLARLWGGKSRLRFGALPASPGEPAALIPDLGRLSGATSWRPRYHLESGLRHTLETWRMTT